MAAYTLRWSSFAASVAGPTFYGEAPIDTLSYTDILNSPGAVAGTIPLNPYPGLTGGDNVFTFDTFREGATLLWVARDGTPVWVGVLWGWDIDTGTDQLAFTGEGIHSYLRRIHLAGQVYSTDQVDIVSNILDYVAVLGGYTDMFTFTAPAFTGQVRDAVYRWWEWTTAADAIDTLAALDAGFDFRWRPVVDSSGIWGVDFYFLYYPGGNDTGLVFDLESNIAGLRMTSDGKNLATLLISTGSGTGSETLLTTTISNELVAAGWPTLETVTTYSDVAETATLQSLTDRDAIRQRTPNRQLELAVYADTLPRVTDYNAGDIVRVTANRGLLQLDQALYRVTVKQVDVDEGGNERVQLSLAPAEMF